MEKNNHSWKLGYINRLKDLIDKQAEGVKAGFAKICGLSDQTLTKSLTGSIPNAITLMRISEGADVSINWLLTGKRPAKEAGDKAWTFSREVKDLYPDLRHVVETANKAADKQKTSYLISALRDVADEIEGIKKSKKVVGR